MNRFSTCMARLVLAVLMMLSWQAAVATTKTVTYTLSRQQEGSTLYIYLTYSGDTPFAGTTTVGRQQESNNTWVTFMLPDGFEFIYNWKRDGGVTQNGNNFYCATKNVSFSLNWSFTNRYVTNVRITDARELSTMQRVK